MNMRIDAKITLLLREQDVDLLRKALQQFTAENAEEAHGRDYLLDVFEHLAMPEDPRQ
jgi:hypothetical protein